MSKREQWLYEKFLKCRSERNEDEQKNYKWVFKKIHFSKLTGRYKIHIKKTWSIIKEAIEKEKIKQQKDCKKIEKKKK